MSLIITVYCSEGIVMASDSRSTYSHTETLPPPDKNMPPLVVRQNGVHFTDNAYKTFFEPKWYWRVYLWMFFNTWKTYHRND